MQHETERPGKDRAFISDEPVRNVVQDGRPGFKLKVRLASYRALPLSCIEGIELKVDGSVIDPDRITFILNGCRHALGDLGSRRDSWWWILDYAELLVLGDHLTPGTHHVEGTLTTVEPYITAGRFSFFHTSSKRLVVDATAQATHD